MTTRKYNKSKQFRKSKKIQRGGELKLNELEELEKDFEKLGYKLENGTYVLRDETKPALDKEITDLITSNLFKPHKIDSLIL